MQSVAPTQQCCAYVRGAPSGSALLAHEAQADSWRAQNSEDQCVGNERGSLVSHWAEPEGQGIGVNSSACTWGPPCWPWPRAGGGVFGLLNSSFGRTTHDGCKGMSSCGACVFIGLWVYGRAHVQCVYVWVCGCIAARVYSTWMGMWVYGRALRVQCRAQGALWETLSPAWITSACCAVLLFCCAHCSCCPACMLPYMLVVRACLSPGRKLPVERVLYSTLSTGSLCPYLHPGCKYGFHCGTPPCVPWTLA